MATVNQTILKRDADGNVIQDSYVGDMAFLGQYTGTNLIYKGFARPGSSQSAAVWQICLLTYDGSDNLLSITWPHDSNGHASSQFNFIWANRASLTYS